MSNLSCFTDIKKIREDSYSRVGLTHYKAPKAPISDTFRYSPRHSEEGEEMKIGLVIDSIWATRKAESLIGVKLMIVQLLDRHNGETGKIIVAADIIGAGIGEKVLITEGSSARNMDHLNNSPIDSIIIGIIDEKNAKSDGVPNYA